jgi:hypothetical protein
VRIVSFQVGSLVYHGYGGEKHKDSDRYRLSGVRHDEDLPDKCSSQDTLPCYKQTQFPWLETLKSGGQAAFVEAKPFFCGPRTTADIYGAQQQNTIVVAHQNPSARSNTIITRKSRTEDLSVPLYHIPQLNGTTITFALMKDVALVDIGSLENAKRILLWADMEVLDGDDCGIDGRDFYPKYHAEMLAKVPKRPPKHPKANAQMLAKVPKMSPKCQKCIGLSLLHETVYNAKASRVRGNTDLRCFLDERHKAGRGGEKIRRGR